MLPLSVFNYFELAALFMALLTYRKLRGSKLRWFVPFLFFIVFVELFGRYYRKVLHQPNAWIYNFSTVVEFLFYSFMFYQHYLSIQYKKLIKYFALIYPFVALINIFFIQGFNYFHSYSMTLGALFMILFSCLYFYDLLQEQNQINLLRTPMFWIASGILFFYLGDFLYNVFFVFIENNQLDFKHKLFAAINNNLILVLYACFTAGFLCLKTPNKSSLP